MPDRRPISSNAPSDSLPAAVASAEPQPVSERPPHHSAARPQRDPLGIELGDTPGIHFQAHFKGVWIHTRAFAPHRQQIHAGPEAFADVPLWAFDLPETGD